MKINLMCILRESKQKIHAMANINTQRERNSGGLKAVFLFFPSPWGFIAVCGIENESQECCLICSLLPPFPTNCFWSSCHVSAGKRKWTDPSATVAVRKPMRAAMRQFLYMSENIA